MMISLCFLVVNIPEQKARDWQTMLWFFSPHNLSNNRDSEAQKISLETCNAAQLLRKKKSKREQWWRYSCIHGQVSILGFAGKAVQPDPLGLAITRHGVGHDSPHSCAFICSSPLCGHFGICHIPAWGFINPTEQTVPQMVFAAPDQWAGTHHLFQEQGFILRFFAGGANAGGVCSIVPIAV